MIKLNIKFEIGFLILIGIVIFVGIFAIIVL